MSKQLKNNRFKYAGIAIIVLVVGIVAVSLTQTQKSGLEGQASPQETSDSTETWQEVRLPESSENTTVYFFYGEGCPYCEKEKPFLEDLESELEGLEVEMYEVYNSEENQELYQSTAQAYGVPATFIGERHWTGYNEEIGEEIEGKIEECLSESCKGPLN